MNGSGGQNGLSTVVARDRRADAGFSHTSEGSLADADRGEEQGDEESRQDGEEDRSGDDGLSQSRRGGSSLRKQTLNALATMSFPAFPAVEEAPFELPTGLVGNDAPLSARKWELATSLSQLASELSEKRLAELHALPERLQRANAAASAVVEVGQAAGRVRRPTAIMRQNVEVARLMGVPGSKQKHVSVHEMGEDKPAPQHLVSSRPKSGALPPAQAAAASKTGTPPARSAGAAGAGDVPAGGLAGGLAARQKGGHSRSPGAGHSGANGHADSSFAARPLPIVVSTAAGAGEPPCTLSNVTVAAVLAERAPAPAPVGKGAVPPRATAAVVLKRGTESPAHADAAGKRTRRPPGWLAGADQWDEDDGAAEGGARRKKRPTNTPAAVAASMADSRLDWASAASVSVTIYGVLPSPSPRTRLPAARDAAMPPPLSQVSSSERSPRVRSSGHSGGAERQGSGGSRESGRGRNSGEAVSDGALVDGF